MVFLSGILLRCTNLNWDGGASYHPDEMNISMAVARLDPPRQWDPQFYAYNGFSVYLYRLAGEGLKALTGSSRWVRDLGSITLVGRWIGAGLSSLTLLLFYLLGTQTGGRTGGLLALTLGAFSPGLIQTAHYSVTESMLLFEIMAVAWTSAKMITMENPPSMKWWLFLGLLGGIALGTKTSAAVLGIFPWVILILRYAKKDRPAPLLRFLLCGAFAGTVFLCVSPYSLLKLRAFLDTMAYEGGIVKGTVEVPYTLQFIGTTPLFWLKNILWHQGPALLLLGVLGWQIGLFAILARRSSPGLLPLLLFSGIYLLCIWNWQGKFIRYTLPLVPGLVLCTAWLLVQIRSRRPRWGLLLMAAALGSTILWGTAVGSIFWRPSTRTAASEWISEHIPRGSVLLTESWDYRLPAPLKGMIRDYRYRTVPAPDRDSLPKARDLAAMLEEGDYLILASRRNWGNLPKLPERYPLMTQYYEHLFDRSLGYEEIQTVTSYPGWGILSLPDERAEETFRVFDHPTIRIFRNAAHHNRKALLEVLVP